MVNYRKDNDNIGVNFGHYFIFKGTQPTLTNAEILVRLRMLGVDEMFSKDELELI